MGFRPDARCHLAVAAAFVVALTGCSAENQSAVPIDPCQRRVDAAASAIDIDETAQLVDLAIGVCGSLSAFETAFAQHPGVLGFSTLEVAARRCLDSSNTQLTNSKICGEAPVIALTGLPPYSSDAGNEVHTGVALDGRAIEITAESGVEFLRGIPAELITIADLASQNDCSALSASANRWRGESEFEGEGDAASIFAHAAEVLAIHRGCAL
ncbi:MAG: hypothetical protein ACO35F_04115 [Ilumatobacteraceae bacterium]